MSSEFMYHFICRPCGHKVNVFGLCTHSLCDIEGEHATDFPKAIHPNIWPEDYPGTSLIMPFMGWPLEQGAIEDAFHPSPALQ